MYKIDVGGTKVRILSNRQIISEQKIAGNINTNPCLASELIDFLRKQAITRNLYIGVAGYYSAPDNIKQDFNALLATSLTNFEVVSDAEFHAKQLINNDQLLVSLGTGSVGSYYNDNQFTVIGGYGHILSDVGSGYHFGKCCILQYLNDFEQNLQLPYMQEIENHFGLSGRAIIGKLQTDEKSQLSELSEMFMDEPEFKIIFELYFEQFVTELKRMQSIAKKDSVVINGSITKSVSFQKAITGLKLNYKIEMI